MAEKREFSITRTRNGFKPRISDNDLPFYQDANGDVTVGFGGANDIFYSGSGSTVVAEMPYMYLGEEDGGLPERQQILTEDDLPEGVELDYRIDGGFNNNCIVVDWTIKNKDLYQVDWVALKTFTGMQMKYVLPKKFPPCISHWPGRTPTSTATSSPARNAPSGARAASSSTTTSRVWASSASP